jgi:hypothetical protein
VLKRGGLRAVTNQVVKQLQDLHPPCSGPCPPAGNCPTCPC